MATWVLWHRPEYLSPRKKKKKKKKLMNILIVNGNPPRKILINRPLIALKFEPKKFND
jgi:hypothetical protein